MTRRSRATLSGVIVVAAAIIVARLMARDREERASEPQEIAPTSKIVVEQP